MGKTIDELSRVFAIGITDKAERIEFPIPIDDGRLMCIGYSLVSLTLPHHTREVYCSKNLLTELTLPSTIKLLFCDTNLLTLLDCPNTIVQLRCDKEVKGLENIIDHTTSIILR